jgi:N-acetylglucosaminyldiphosphoundecaprenol N-acetyl-beta-D-mannosaminyltransferase
MDSSTSRRRPLDSEHTGRLRCLKTVDFLGAPLSLVTMSEAVEIAQRAITERRACYHGCLNSAVVARLASDSGLREAFWDLDLVTADGQSIVWAGRLLGLPVPERVTGIDLMIELLASASRHQQRVYVLGAEPTVLRQALENIKVLYPNVVLVGSHHGYFGPSEEHLIVQEINSARPDILFVALPTPKKEVFLTRNRIRLGTAFAASVGGSLDVLAGRRRRAPRWMQRLGLEWLVRLIQEPIRLGPRYLLGNPRFIGLVVDECVRRR